MSDAWDNPVAFVRELSRYYRQLERTGHRVPAREWADGPTHTKETN